MPDESVNCIVTSPPYWGLRDYGVVGQIGMESTLALHLQIMVEVFRECRRVLRKDGTVWLNYGDCYATSPNGRSAADTKATGKDDRTFRDKPFSTIGGVLKPKDLCMIPARLAIALQEDGWWIRSEIIWAKPNPMPESIRDRPVSSHEKVYLLSRSERYWYDAQAVRTRMKDSSIQRRNQLNFDNQMGGPKDSKTGNRSHRKTLENLKKRDRVPASWASSPSYENQDPRYKKRDKGSTRKKDADADAVPPGSDTHRLSEFEKKNGGEYESANLRNVWHISTSAFPEAHFATFPTALVEPCIKAGCPEGGLVLDPFGGAGTVGLVADQLQRNALMFELNPEYAAIAERRLKKDGGMFIDLTIEPTPTIKERCRKP